MQLIKPFVQTILKTDFILNVNNTKQKIFQHVPLFLAQFPIVVICRVSNVFTTEEKRPTCFSNVMVK